MVTHDHDSSIPFDPGFSLAVAELYSDILESGRAKKIRHSTPKNTIVFVFLSKNTFLYFLSVYFPHHDYDLTNCRFTWDKHSLLNRGARIVPSHTWDIYAWWYSLSIVMSLRVELRGLLLV